MYVSSCVELLSSSLQIRYWINQMLAKTEPDQIMKLTQPKALDSAQKGIRAQLELLFQSERCLQEKASLGQGREFRWNLLKKQNRMSTPQHGEENYIFKVQGWLLSRCWLQLAVVSR